MGSNEEEQFSDEQVGPQVAVNGAVVRMPGHPLAAQGGKAGGQTHQRYRDAHPGNHVDEKLLDTDPELMRGIKSESVLSWCRLVSICECVLWAGARMCLRLWWRNRWC